MTEQLRLMAVHAHPPDDESSKGAATMAKYVSEGVDVLVVTCTGGERGSILNPKLQGDAYIEENIHEVRRKEMDEAREILGVKQEWLGFVDSGLPEGDRCRRCPRAASRWRTRPSRRAASSRRSARSGRRSSPRTTRTGGYPHPPDHIMTHTISMIAFEGAADTEKFPPRRSSAPPPGRRRSSTTTRASTGRAPSPCTRLSSPAAWSPRTGTG
ncbi:hypothetical protein GTV15_22175 [Streptomyces sp. SID7803]|nr:hypothetical protein [Streptomyces sp. SID7803]